ncbi:DUF4360 domain-containing protein [Lentzea sp. NPDC004789]
MIHAIVAAAMAMSTVVLPQADVPPPGAVTIDTINGSGCPKGTTTVTVSPDNSAFHVVFSSYAAKVGPGAAPTDFRKNCQLSIRVNAPDGFVYGISEVDYAGYLHLERGATSSLKSSFYFQGMADTGSRSHSWQGPVDDEWRATDVGSPIIYPPCGVNRNLNINTELRVNVGTSDAKKASFMAMDSLDGHAKTDYIFSWKRCS